MQNSPIDPLELSGLGKALDQALNESSSHIEEHVVQPARFGSLGGSRESAATQHSIDFLYDVNLQVAVELGRTDLTIREVLDLGLGSIVELNKLAGEPVDILINGRPIARGEVVVIDDMFGVRVIDILSPYDRINSLR
jgi:flagellar motor switch protein FliN/FliY